MYQTRYKGAILVEGFGNSPIVSVNYEHAFIRYKKSFWAARAGLGYMPGIQNPPPGFKNESGISVPLAVTYNWATSNINFEKTLFIKTFPRRFTFEPFIETGLGYTFVQYSSRSNRNFIFGTIAARVQLLVDIPPKKRVFFARVSLNPVYFDDTVTLIYRSPGGGYRFFGGFALGMSI